ncbi:MAG: leucyl/phenylalanyl-tRNA--protein transferase [Endozoicomonas sp. (ex Botrylloides leachii)]|nr:leucyl/phenylalanyl-tRNA--protein transferase [Endozoicomonas sp. (ex Botrylloides leachii)]
MIPWLNETSPVFPDTNTALKIPDGLLAAGGNLNGNTLLEAYSRGIFPWFNEGEPILWWSPDPRMVLKPASIIISRSLRKILRKNIFKVTFDRAFDNVIDQCSKPRGDEMSSWITNTIKRAYSSLHATGYAHSVEVWADEKLVGGLYGVAIGKVFFGESMFSTQNNTSKVAFAWLCHHLLQWKFKLIDCQVYSPHLQSLGASMMPRIEFINQLNCYCSKNPSGANWIAERQWNDLLQ